jgi:dihydroxyacetone kinase DhaKLM complex PTS-EIIA-like component DhaM
MAANTLTASALAADAVTEIQSGLSTLDAAGVRTAVGLASANLDTQLAAIDDLVDTEVAAIKTVVDAVLVDTNELQTDWADGGRLDVILDARASQTSVDTVDDFLDTEIAAIKAKTDNLPASPAAVGSAMTLTSGERTAVADALLDRDMSTGTDSGSATVRTVRQALRFLRNKWSLSGTTLTVTKEDDTTASWTATVTTNAAAEPITASDPASS